MVSSEIGAMKTLVHSLNFTTLVLVRRITPVKTVCTCPLSLFKINYIEICTSVKIADSLPELCYNCPLCGGTSVMHGTLGIGPNPVFKRLANALTHIFFRSWDKIQDPLNTNLIY
jgi:hypothetical protein